MLWKQFFTPAQSFDADAARKFLADRSPESVTILDVRQPGEYETGHIPGAQLIPLPDLGDRLDEIDATRPCVVYCAVGGRSRVAAQMLQGKGFAEIYNLTGGIKAWNGQTAIGSPDQGLGLFAETPSLEACLKIAYSLEKGLEDFYRSLLVRVKNEDAAAVFRKLADIEINHQQRIFEEYGKAIGQPITREAFDRDIMPDVVEGGMSTEAYLERFGSDLNSATDIVAMAMSIEGQALDLYQRAAAVAEAIPVQEMLLQIAAEERTHLNELGKLMDRLT